MDDTQVCTKKCNRCLEFRPLALFSKNVSVPGGLDRRCKLCDATRRLANRELFSARSKSSRQKRLEYYREKSRAYSANNYEKRAEYAKEYAKKNPDKVRALSKKWHQENPEKAVAKRDKWRAKNYDVLLAGSRNWKKKNKGAVNEINRAREITKKNAMPHWANREKIKEIYREAAAKRVSVDHIIPLRGKTVCGLHIPINLQLLPLKINISKGNRFDPNVFDNMGAP